MVSQDQVVQTQSGEGTPKHQVTCRGSKERERTVRVQNSLAAMGSSMTADP